MGRCIDLTGQKFGKLTVIKKEKSSADGDSKWLCECECGNSIIMRGASLRKTAVIPKSCGCLQKEFMRKRNKANKKRNTYDLNGDYGIGYSSNDNEPFYFDLEDYDKIKNYYWYSNHDGYMCSRENKKEIIMHRLIMNESNPEIEVDHFNRNRKDNRKKNLRSLTREHNNWNKGLQTNNESGVTGVRWNKEAQKWVAYIMRKHLGTFNRFEDAVKARKRAEQKYFGEYSYNNINNQKQQLKVKDGE